MATLVTGGAGFIGSHVMERLVQEEHEVICLDDFNDYYPPEVKRRNIASLAESGAIKLYEGDICDRELCQKVFREHPIKLVIHLAARAGVRASLADAQLYQRVNCGGTLNLLESAREAQVENFVFGSSSSVYGDRNEVPFREEDVAASPASPYAATKRAGELFCYTFHHLYGLPIVCLRFFTVYGPRQRPEMAIHKFTRLVDEGRPIQVYGDGSSQRDYTYVSDILAGVMAAAKRRDGFEIINLGSSHPYRLDYLVSLIEDSLERRADVQHLPEQPGDVRVTYADVRKAERLLDYHPQTSLEAGLSAFVKWYREEGKGR